MTLDRLELAWAAGFFDGEGCTVGRHDKRITRSQPMLSIGQSERTTLDRFQAAVCGLGRIIGPYQTRGKPVWFYRTSRFEHTQAVLAMLWRFLSQPKRDQATAVLRYVHAQPRRKCGPKQGYQQSREHVAKRITERIATIRARAAEVA